MNQFQRYLIDEFVEDYRDGRMSRRDFVMKVIGSKTQVVYISTG